MLNNIVMISVSMSVVILLLLIISPILNKRCSAKWRYFVWLILALRLIIPFWVEFPKAPVNIPKIENQAIVFKQVGMPFAITDDSYGEHENVSQASADYTPIITFNGLLYIIWACGAVGFFLYRILSYFAFKRRIKAYCKSVNCEIFKSVLNDMKIKNPPQLLECSRISSPMMIGFFKPMILMPNTRYLDEEISVVLKHELTHYKRRDVWYKLILIIANSMHWFNPLVYIMKRQANRDLEYFCDDMVVVGSDMNYRKRYSMVILKSMVQVEATALSTYLNGGSGNE